VRSTSVDGLDVMTRGAVPSNPSELLMGRLFGDFIHQASEEYDLIILDTPPILAVTDPAIIGVYAATSLIIARFELCSVKQISSALRRFELSGIEIKGLVFNAVEKKSSGYYYDYGYYNYDYNSDN
jgi:tyrosine-protein kinase Etk/Wzc